MTVKELRELLNDVPDNYTVGYSEEYEINGNWYGSYKSEIEFYKLSADLTCNIKDKTLSLFKFNRH